MGFMTPDMLVWTAALAGGGAAACVAWALLSALRRARDFHQAAAGEIVVSTASSGLVRTFLPLAHSSGLGLRALVTGGRKRGVFARLHDGVVRSLSAAGNPEGLNADEYLGFGLLLAIMGGFGGALCYGLLSPDAMFSIYTYFGGGAMLGAAWWRSWLTRRMVARQTSIRRNLPFCLDLLTLSMEAGLDFTSALTRMARKIGGSPLGQEFNLLLREIQLGKTRTAALRDFSNRVDVPEVRSFVASLVQAEELGSPLGAVLRIQATQLRITRSQRAEEEAMKAPVKMLFPLVVFIFPVTLVVIFGPLLLSGLFNF